VSQKLAKSLPSGTAEDGIHVHLLDVEAGKTQKDGAHTHKFQLPDGTVIVTEEGGEHQHWLDNYSSEFYIWWSGEHTHKVTYPDGTTQWTSVDGTHGHQPQPTSTAFDGVHSHTLVYNGEILRSLTSKDIYELMFETATEDAEAKSPPASVLAAITKSGRTCELRLSKEGLHFDFGDSSLTLAAVVKKDFEGKVDLQKAVASWTPEVFCAGPIPVGKAAPGVGTLVSKCSLSAGVVTPDRVELFAESEVFTQRLELTPTAAGWVCKVALSTPLALCTKNRVPPKGISGLPFGVEKQIPVAVRYWEMEDRERAQKALDWLVESGFATNEEMGFQPVGKELVLVTVDKAVYEFLPDETTSAGIPTWISKLTDCLPRDIPVVSPFAEEDWRAEAAIFRKSNVLMLMDVPSQDELADVCAVVAKSKFVIGADDSAENRASLGSIGRLFKINDAGAFDRLFATNVDFGHEVLLPVYQESATPIAKSRLGILAVPTPAENPVLNRMNKATEKVRVVLKAENDERYVLGVVAEPEETDTQGDTQSAAEVKKAAYGFLEDFRNIGLQHKQFINSQVKIVESYIAKVDEGAPGDAGYVKKGSWLMAVRVLDDDLWLAVKSGAITGFSFGGYAERVAIEKN
jgi:hypothetical protein